MRPITLAELMRAVEATAAEGSALARLRAAVRAAEELHELGDELLDRFVKEARSAGCSWAEIGGVLGVSKQAAQQRFVARPTVLEGAWPERFSEGARGAVAHGAEEARSLGHNFLGTEHVLLGLLAQSDGIAAHALTELGIAADAVRERIRELVGVCEPRQWESLGVMPRLKQAFELARREANSLGHNRVGTEHLLLGLVHVRGALARRILEDLGANDERVREQLASMLGVDAPELAARMRQRRRRLRILARAGR